MHSVISIDELRPIHQWIWQKQDMSTGYTINYSHFNWCKFIKMFWRKNLSTKNVRQPPRLLLLVHNHRTIINCWAANMTWCSVHEWNAMVRHFSFLSIGWFTPIGWWQHKICVEPWVSEYNQFHLFLSLSHSLVTTWFHLGQVNVLIQCFVDVCALQWWMNLAHNAIQWILVKAIVG